MKVLAAKLLLVVSLFPIGSTLAEENSINVRTFEVDASELKEFLGIDIYKFVFKQKVGDEFDVVLRQFDARGKEPRELLRSTFTVTRTQAARGDNPEQAKAADISLLVCFLKRDHTIGSALLSNDKEVAVRIESPYCRGSMGTNVALPLADVKQKTLLNRVRAETPRPKNTDGAALLVLHANGDKTDSVNYPYAELAIVPKR